MRFIAVVVGVFAVALATSCTHVRTLVPPDGEGGRPAATVVPVASLAPHYSVPKIVNGMIHSNDFYYPGNLSIRGNLVVNGKLTVGGLIIVNGKRIR